MEFLNFRLSDNEKYDLIFKALNPQYEESYEMEYFILSVYDEYVICQDRNMKNFRAYYTKNDETNTVELGEKIEVFIVDVTEVEYKALQAIQSTAGNYSNIEQKMNEYSEEIATKNTEIENKEATISSLNETVTTLNETISNNETKIEELNNSISAKDEEISTLKTENMTITAEKDSLAQYKENLEKDAKEEILSQFSQYLTESQITELQTSMTNFSVTDFKKEVCVMAWDEKVKTEQNTNGKKLPKVPEEENTGALGILNKHSK